jgi:hypothetical protein
MIDLLRQIKTEWIIALISIGGVIGTMVTAYIKFGIDKGKIDNKFRLNDKKFEQYDEKFEQMEEAFKGFQEASMLEVEKNRKENREEHNLMFKRIDEIKDILIQNPPSRKRS